MKQLIAAILLITSLHGNGQRKDSVWAVTKTGDIIHIPVTWQNPDTMLTHTPAIWIHDNDGKVIVVDDEHGLQVGDSLKAIVKLAELVRMNYERYERAVAKLDSIQKQYKKSRL